MPLQSLSGDVARTIAHTLIRSGPFVLVSLPEDGDPVVVHPPDLMDEQIVKLIDGLYKHVGMGMSPTLKTQWRGALAIERAQAHRQEETS